MLATPGPLPAAEVEDQWALEVKQDGSPDTLECLTGRV